MKLSGVMPVYNETATVERCISRVVAAPYQKELIIVDDGSPCVIHEVPISYSGRTHAKGKKITWRDGFAALAHIVRFNAFRTAAWSFRRDWSDVPGLVEAGEIRENGESQSTCRISDWKLGFARCAFSF